MILSRDQARVSERPYGRGSAELHVALIRGASSVLRSRARSPVCLLTPRARGASVWACSSSLGGGLVAGDEVRFELQVDDHARCFFGTQASTKVYRNPDFLPCSHSLEAHIGSGALLALAPDPVQCFAGARYEQRQSFHLAPDANLILLDWVSAGRLARGERWAFQRYFSANEVHRESRLIIADALELDSTASNPFRSGRFNCLATLLLLGPKLQPHAVAMLRRVADRPIAPGDSLLLAASPLQDGVLLRMATNGVETAGRAIAEHLHFLPELLQDDPWARKW